MADFSTSVIAVRGCRIRLMRAGAGDPLVYLHGASGAAWLPVLQKLSEKYDVIAPEHPGFGESDTPDWLDTIHDLAYFYLDVFDQLKISDAHLVGNSLGGWLAAEIAVRNTSHLASLTLCDAAGIYVPGVEQSRLVHAERRAAAARILLRSEKGRGDGRARHAPGPRGHRAEEPRHGRETVVAAARSRSASAEVAAPHRRADAGHLGRPRQAFPNGTRRPITRRFPARSW